MNAMCGRTCTIGNGSKSTKVYKWTKNFDDALSVLYNKPCASVIDL